MTENTKAPKHLKKAKTSNKLDKQKKETHKAIAQYISAKKEHSKATKEFDKSVKSFKKKAAQHQSLAE